MNEIIIATKNRGKFAEMKDMLLEFFERFYTLWDLEEIILDEDGETYVENAMKKARKVAERFGIKTIADDSGLEVKFLSGRPGIFSSRYGKDDEEKIERLLRELRDVPFESRQATFKAYVALFDPEKERHHIFFGDLKGYIAFEKRGTNGFGFDPVFFLPELKKTLAELTMAEKNKISHRAKALLALKTYLT